MGGDIYPLAFSPFPAAFRISAFQLFSVSAFAYNLSMTTASATSPPSEAPRRNPVSPAAPVSRGVGWFTVAVLGFVWVYAVYRLGTLWYTNSDYAYGWFVPLLCAALFWERWQRRPAPEALEASSGPLIIWLVLALTLMPSCFFLEVIPYWRFAGWAFAGAIIGITFCALYLVGGRRWVHHFAFPLLFFLIAVPWPGRIEAPLISKLSHLNAALSTWVANWLGTPAIRQGVIIQTGAGMVGIDEACSGIRSFQAAVMVALFLGELFRYAFSRRLFFLLSGVALAFGCNVVRTTYLVRVCDLKGKAAVNLAHDPAGFTILGVTLAGLLLLAWLFRGRGDRGKAEMLKLRSGWQRTEGGGRQAEGRGKREEGGGHGLLSPSLFPREGEGVPKAGEGLVQDDKASAGSSFGTSPGETAAEAEVRLRWSDEVGQASSPAGSPGVPPGAGKSLAAGAPPEVAGEDAYATLGHSPYESRHALTAALLASVIWIVCVEAEIEVWFRPAESRVAAVTSNWSLQLPTQQPEFRQPQISDKVRDMLKYDEGQQAQWREAGGRPWEVFYFRWHPARTKYRAMDITQQAQGHAPDVCLKNAGMTLQNDLGRQIRRVNGVTLLADLERFSDQGRPLHVLSCYWEPDPAALDYQPASPASTANAMRNAWHALRFHERGRNEKRVLKVAVWGMETDAEAEAAFQEFLARAIQP